MTEEQDRAQATAARAGEPSPQAGMTGAHEAQDARAGAHDGRELTAANEDYLEAIVILEQSSRYDEIRSVDIANLLVVSKASVNKALTSLRNAGYVEQERYGRVTLTEAGRAYGTDLWGRHQTLRRFLVKDLGVDPELANEEACRMEHSVSSDTVRRLREFLDREHGADDEGETSSRDAIRDGVTVKFEK